MTRDDLLAAAGPSVDPGRWLGTFDELMTRAGARFSRVEPRRRARAFVLGLLAELPRAWCWELNQEPTTAAGYEAGERPRIWARRLKPASRSAPGPAMSCTATWSAPAW